MGGAGGPFLLRVAGIACVVAGLFPWYYGSLPVAADDTVEGLPTADVRLGLPFSPSFSTYRETFGSTGSTTMLEEDGSGARASSFSSTVWGFRGHAFSWSAALAVAGAILLVVSFRSPGRAAGPESPGAEAAR